MQLLNLTLPSAEENLALDEALLETAESSLEHDEVLRFWESPQTCVVLGRGSPYEQEVNRSYCRENDIPVLRRCSGGATVVAGPGCLMYALLLDYRKRPELRMLDVAHQFVMGKMIGAFQRLGVAMTMEGTCDLVVEGRKVSGNALRCKRNYMLYHGTLLFDLSIDTIAQCLHRPVRQPEYREDRSHQEFLGRLPMDAGSMITAIALEWMAVRPMTQWPVELTQQLATQKYGDSTWTQKC